MPASVLLKVALPILTLNLPGAVLQAGALLPPSAVHPTPMQTKLAERQRGIHHHGLQTRMRQETEGKRPLGTPLRRHRTRMQHRMMDRVAEGRLRGMRVRRHRMRGVPRLVLPAVGGLHQNQEADGVLQVVDGHRTLMLRMEGKPRDGMHRRRMTLLGMLQTNLG